MVKRTISDTNLIFVQVNKLSLSDSNALIAKIKNVLIGVTAWLVAVANGAGCLCQCMGHNDLTTKIMYFYFG